MPDLCHEPCRKRAWNVPASPHVYGPSFRGLHSLIDRIVFGDIDLVPIRPGGQTHAMAVDEVRPLGRIMQAWVRG